MWGLMMEIMESLAKQIIRTHPWLVARQKAPNPNQDRKPLKHIHLLRISFRQRSIWGLLWAKETGAFRSIKLLATGAVLSLAVAGVGEASSSSEQPGLWSAPGTWAEGAVPNGRGNVMVFHPLTLDIDSGPTKGALMLLGGSLHLDPGVVLTVPDAGLLVFGGTSISGSGVIEGALWSTLALPGGTVTSSFDVTEIDVYTGTVGTVRQGTAINLFLEPSNTLRIVQDQGQTDGLTLDGNLYFQFSDGTAKIDLGFDAGSGGNDWAFRWKGDRDAYLTGLLGTQLTFSGAPTVDIFYNANDNYTYVAASHEDPDPSLLGIPEPSVFGLIGASGMLLLRRRMRQS